jgi:outer membrane receptor for ferrienterochelin and colicins
MNPFRCWPAWAGLVCTLAHAQAPRAPAAAASSPAAASAPTPTASTPSPERRRPGATQQVEITGASGGDNNADRRRSTASRIVYGREELDRMGDSSLGEVLKRLPGVSIGGAPGRGGQIRMRGMGGGYTQILIDGQRMPMGFSLDSVAPEQIERIEIMRAPVAEHGARAIAGTINVVMREDFKRRANELKLGGGFEGDRPQAGLNWTYSGQNESLGYNVTGTAFRNKQGSETRSVLRRFGDDGLPDLERFASSTSSRARQGLFVSSRLQLRIAPGENLELQPFVHLSRSSGTGQGTQVQLGTSDNNCVSPDDVGDCTPYASELTRDSARTAMARLNGSWLKPTGNGGRLQLRFGSMLADNENSVQREEFRADGSGLHRRDEAGSQRDVSIDLNGKYAQLLAERHSFAVGWELQRGQRRDQRRTQEDGRALLTAFGDNLEARTLRVAGYVQDEWEWSKTYSFYAGLRWEGIETRSDSALESVRNRSSVLTPLVHMVWKLPDAPRDQVRLGLTRSYRAPNTSDLIARPRISTGENNPANPDRAGNPALRPELAWGLDLAFEHYLEAGGIVSANAFVRSIDDLIRRAPRQELVTYLLTDVPTTRWVSRPQNIGGALAAGIELEAKARASDLWNTELPLSLRGNLSLLWSRVDGVPGPNNRLDQQPRYTANIGFDLPLRGTPLTLGGNLNYTPAIVIQQIDDQQYRQGRKRVVDAYALWRFGASASARLSVSNAGALDYETGGTTYFSDGGWQTQDTVAKSYTTVTLRGELRF